MNHCRPSPGKSGTLPVVMGASRTMVASAGSDVLPIRRRSPSSRMRGQDGLFRPRVGSTRYLNAFNPYVHTRSLQLVFLYTYPLKCGNDGGRWCHPSLELSCSLDRTIEIIAPSIAEHNSPPAAIPSPPTYDPGPFLQRRPRKSMPFRQASDGTQIGRADSRLGVFGRLIKFFSSPMSGSAPGIANFWLRSPSDSIS